MHPRLALAALLLAGCGDYVGATGALGKLTYGLGIDYEIDGDLDEVSVITGHPQNIRVSLTPDGEDDARKPWLITHAISPSDGTTLTVEDTEEGDELAPDLTVTVTQPDLYILESYYDGELLDYIKIDFDQPDALRVLSWVREPNADDFTQSSFEETLSVTEGTQVALLPIPYADNNRLAGDFSVAYSHTPEDAAVTVHNVSGVYEEEGVLGSVNAGSLIFIDPAEVVVTITDEANGVSAERTYEVADGR